ncbi:hypothetical protein F4778DRAFT_777004 [Xylariomycetidae sp. FL2044]|nr:hypothetical protein F4778DRAFT_777004 [Xylariomycetidae sp. FL2044]
MAAAAAIFLDFDGTITTQDTIGHLAQFALTFQASQGGAAAVVDPQGRGGPVVDDDDLQQQLQLKPRWDAVVQSYVSDRGAHAAAYSLPPERRLDPRQEIAFLRDLKGVEDRSLARVRACGLFRGIPPEAFREAGRRLVEEGGIRRRKGFEEFVRQRQRRMGRRGREGEEEGDVGGGVVVVSVNWSSAFIEGACSGVCDGGDGVEEEEEEGEEGLEGLEVIANDVVPEDGRVVGPAVLMDDHDDEEGVGQEGSEAGEGEQEEQGRERRRRRNLTNSRDKLDVMRAVLKRGGERGGGGGGRTTFYFGDSTTDLECLLEADRGIVIADGEDSSLLKTLRRIGMEVPHVRDGFSKDGLAWASDFEEVMANVEFDAI